MLEYFGGPIEHGTANNRVTSVQKSWQIGKHHAWFQSQTLFIVWFFFRRFALQTCRGRTDIDHKTTQRKSSLFFWGGLGGGGGKHNSQVGNTQKLLYCCKRIPEIAEISENKQMKTSSGVQLKGFGNFRVNKVVPIFFEGATYYSDASNFLIRKGGSRNCRFCSQDCVRSRPVELWQNWTGRARINRYSLTGMQDGDILWRTELVERDDANIKYTNAVKRKLVLIPALTSQLPQQSK